ncbi:CoA pyrophosphatase [Rhizobium sp. TH2]|uniref:CoA pyrophosphatase n=1 Tax=Rhizobium sp. TH2 TaxID=2775403 RepID=UPI0021576F27|nr:CoA pyrophosphatase [Rhizobium sp. TH2]UVC07094.1 CoA pyrophosphatase [Rhizobium sp. TH2]
MSIFTASDFRLRAERHAGGNAEDFLEYGDYRLNSRLHLGLEGMKLRDAAVLVGIVEDDEAHVILTKRTDALRKHSGQIAFPGGQLDPGESAEVAAVREAEEEIGLARHFVDVIGALPAIPVLSGFRITPVLATIRTGFTLNPSPDEVEHVFQVPLAFLMNPGNHEEDVWKTRGLSHKFYVMPYDGWRIWGITAGIIRSVYERLYE